MKDLDELQAFSERLNDLCDEPQFHIAPRDGGRQSDLARRFQVSQNAARKWLTGDGMPKQARAIRIAKYFHVNYEWLVTGRGPKRPDTQPTLIVVTDPEELALVRRVRSMAAEERQAFITMTKPWQDKDPPN